MVTSLKKGIYGKGVSYGMAGSAFANIFSFLIFLLLNSKDFCVKYLKTEDRIISNQTFLLFVCVIQILALIYICFFKEK